MLPADDAKPASPPRSSFPNSRSRFSCSSPPASSCAVSRKAQGFDPGFNPDHVLVASYDLYAAGYTWQKGLEFDRQLLAKARRCPRHSIRHARRRRPARIRPQREMVKLEGYAPQPHEAMDVRSATVGPNYLRTLQIPLVEGRDFTPGGHQIVSAGRHRRRPSLLRDATGQSGCSWQRVWAEAHCWSTIVGIARNSDYDQLNERPQPFLFIPMLQDYWTAAIIEVRVPGNPMAFASAVEKTVHELNTEMPLYGVAPLTTFTQVASSRQRIAGTFVGSFGVLALILATVGIYGVVAYSTRQRTHEIGIRVALGASRGHILRLVLGHGLRLTLAGLAAGLLLAVGVTRLMRSELFGVAPTDALTYSIVAALLSGVALAACTFQLAAPCAPTPP